MRRGLSEALKEGMSLSRTRIKWVSIADMGKELSRTEGQTRDGLLSVRSAFVSYTRVNRGDRKFQEQRAH